MPAAKYRAPTSTTRGGPLAVTNAIIDDDSHTAPTLFAWSKGHVRRMVERIAPSVSGVFAALGDIKPFARTGNATKPSPEDLAPGPVSGRVLGLGMEGGQFVTAWQWVALGIGIQDIATQVSAHDSAADAHEGIREAYALADSNLMTSIAAVMAGYESGDAALQAAIDALPTTSGGSASASIAALLSDSPHASDAVSHTVPNWRDYPALGMVYFDTSDTIVTHYYAEVNTRVLDAIGTFAVALEKRAQLIITRTADSDVVTLTANTTGSDFVPATGDTFSFYGLA